MTEIQPNERGCTQVIVHLAKHLGNVLIFLILLPEDWGHVPYHHLPRILSCQTGHKRVQSRTIELQLLSTSYPDKNDGDLNIFIYVAKHLLGDVQVSNRRK